MKHHRQYQQFMSHLMSFHPFCAFRHFLPHNSKMTSSLPTVSSHRNHLARPAQWWAMCYTLWQDWCIRRSSFWPRGRSSAPWRLWETDPCWMRVAFPPGRWMEYRDILIVNVAGKMPPNFFVIKFSWMYQKTCEFLNGDLLLYQRVYPVIPLQKQGMV